MELRQIDDHRWEVMKTGAMRVPGIIYTSATMIDDIRRDAACQQVANVATLPGICKASLAMPDIHFGYGFPIGGVAAFDLDEGIISPGGVGYDINCGVRLAGTRLMVDEVIPRLEDLANALAAGVPSGVGVKGSLKLSVSEEKKAIAQGSLWAVKHGLGDPEDIDHTEDGGCIEGADPAAVSDKALDRGRTQIGTLGSGNHFMEIGVVKDIYDEQTAARFGLFMDQITVMIHSGSRGLGHQVCDDYLKTMAKAVHKEHIPLVDKQLACTHINSAAGKRYFSAMACAANYAWINRQVLMHHAREIFPRVFQKGPAEIGMQLIYDVCHNIAKKETHEIDGEKRLVCVHRKGATRSLPSGHPDLCEKYRGTGQPVITPGDMGTGSYVMVGCEKAMAQTFGSTCHGAGRILSRNAAKKTARGRDIFAEMKAQGVILRCSGKSTAAEEMPEAYKNVDDVVKVIHEAGISRKVARIKPLAVFKG
ncbi:MAG: RtcB family protein [Thermodesulfobacteriota bacterium]|nr:RtcB family protein [Thermodesulfobacteriota bacterium]